MRNLSQNASELKCKYWDMLVINYFASVVFVVDYVASRTVTQLLARDLVTCVPHWYIRKFECVILQEVTL